MTNRLSGKTALVTAAGQGIGRASALAMAREGVRVYATDVDEQALAGLAREHEGIRCNALCPGTVESPSLQSRMATFRFPWPGLPISPLPGPGSTGCSSPPRRSA